MAAIFGVLQPIINDDYIFPAWMNPAGGVHCNIGDYALYARLIVYPALNLAFAGFTNCGNGNKALDEAFRRMTGLEWKS